MIIIFINSLKDKVWTVLNHHHLKKSFFYFQTNFHDGSIMDARITDSNSTWISFFN